MPRQARIKSRSGIYHIMLRGINRQIIFEDDEDKKRFVDTLLKYKHNYYLFAYCIMDNHVHVLLKETSKPLSDLIKRISSSYVYWYNMKYNRCGHLFQARFKSENVETKAYFLTVLRYIHQNPLKAGLVKDVFQSRWTSIHEYCKNERPLDIELPLNLFSNNKTRAVTLFKEYMSESTYDLCLEDPPSQRITDDEVRIYLRKLGVSNKSMLQGMNKEQRNEVLVNLKTLKGVSERQISRVTGVSRKVIQKVR
ncbi:MAG: transposase [Bacillota bacterium]